VSIQRKQNVVKLEITVDDAVLMEVLQRKTDFCCVESVIS